MSQNSAEAIREVSGKRLADLDNADDRFDVYNVSGIKIGSFAKRSDIGTIPHKGLLIVRHIHNDEVLDIQK